MNIVVTGAGGLIGSHATRLLREKGFNVFGVYKKDYKLGKNFIVGDLTNKKFLFEISNINPKIIIHCAAVLPGIGNHTITSSSQINRIIDKNIIDYCEKNACKLIYISGTAIYGVSNKVLSEGEQVGAVSAYVLEKYYSELEIQKRLRDYIILRVSAPYGPQQKSNTVLKKFILQILNNESLKYFGTGSRSQDFTHVDDVANAILLSIKDLVPGIYNIASGRPISMLNLALLIKSLFPESKSIIEPANIIDPEEDFRALYDISKAQRTLGWAPKIRIEDGIIQLANHLHQIK